MEVNDIKPEEQELMTSKENPITFNKVEEKTEMMHQKPYEGYTD